MSLDVDVTTNGERLAVSRARVIEIARRVLRSEGVRNALVSITMLDRTAMARLNATHLKHKGPTDVISFGFSRATPSDPVVGDIYICPAVGRANAAARREPVRRELARLVVHGVLHILGHDHPESDQRERSPMWRRQEQIVARLSSAARR
jgi:probable rRNA maturation factor